MLLEMESLILLFLMILKLILLLDLIVEVIETCQDNYV